LAGPPNQLVRGFLERFGTDSSAPLSLYRGPGRINLIGDHTDYSGGLVLPMAIEQACWVAVRDNKSRSLRIHAADLSGHHEIAFSALSRAQPLGNWSDYVVGVALELSRAGVSMRGSDLYITSTVPMGAGLSSSAAIEVASALALLRGSGPSQVRGAALAKLCQRAENHFAGTPCGIMDQFVSVHGKAGCAVRIDCRSLEHETVALPSEVLVVAVNSMVKRQLGGSEYPKRRKQCEDAAAALGLETLRDATAESILRLKDHGLLRRARHVVSENARVELFLRAALAGDSREMGRLLLASHASLRDDYEVSCDELDFLVKTASELPYVFGARMTGGGFGGCTVNLIHRDHFEEFREAMRTGYHKRYQIDPQIFACEAAEGAGIYPA